MDKLTSTFKRLYTIVTWRRLILIALVGGLVWSLVIAGLAFEIRRVGALDQAESADVIIVLGSGLRRDGRPGDALYRRSVWAASLYQQGMADAVICTGGVGRVTIRSEADACLEVLTREGVPADAIFLEEKSHSTEENAIYAAQIMAEKGMQDAILVTDSFHMLRASWIVSDYGIEHSRSPVPSDWVRSRFYVRHFTREILALHWQALKVTLNLPVTRI